MNTCQLIALASQTLPTQSMHAKETQCTLPRAKHRLWQTVWTVSLQTKLNKKKKRWSKPSQLASLQGFSQVWSLGLWTQREPSAAFFSTGPSWQAALLKDKPGCESGELAFEDQRQDRHVFPYKVDVDSKVNRNTFLPFPNLAKLHAVHRGKHVFQHLPHLRRYKRGEISSRPVWNSNQYKIIKKSTSFPFQKRCGFHQVSVWSGAEPAREKRRSLCFKKFRISSRTQAISSA